MPLPPQCPACQDTQDVVIDLTGYCGSCFDTWFDNLTPAARRAELIGDDQ